MNDKMHEWKFQAGNIITTGAAMLGVGIDQLVLVVLAVIGWGVNLYWNVRSKRQKERILEEQHKARMKRICGIDQADPDDIE